MSAVINKAAFAGVSADDIEVAVRVLRIATDRLNAFVDEGRST